MEHLLVFWQDRLGVTGQLMWMLFLLMGLAALPFVRRLYYEAFYYVHHLYLVNIVLLYVHSQNGLAIRYVTGPLAVFVCDYLYRSVRSYPLVASRRARIRYIKFHPSDVVEVGFDRRELLQHTRVGQYVKLCVPELGIFQWHPFTITATPSETKVMADSQPHGIWKIHFKVSGNWTYQLSQRLYKVTSGGDAYTNVFDQEARIGRVVNDVIAPEIVPLQCRDDESDANYVMAMADHLDAGDSAVAVGAGQGLGTSPVEMPNVAPSEPHTASSMDAPSPLDSMRTCRVVLAPKKGEPDGSSFMSSGGGSGSSLDDDVWFVPEPAPGRSQTTLPTILVDGPYNAPMESFFEYHANIIVAAGIGITPYIAALEQV
ncbi:NADPH oxidase 3, partial [Coemansia sp. RSA 2611]